MNEIALAPTSGTYTSQADNKLLYIDFYKPEGAKLLVKMMSSQYGLNFEEFYNTADCESNFVYNKKGDFINGVPTSFGIWQIHLPAHPEVSKEVAFNPVYSTIWSAIHFKENPSAWTCWHLLGYNK